uniref:Uncharacterized protein LOC114349178 n=1 Tax=Diabrotica virgifera virgifera TaxID=50390 RepID=A0A6P7H056_DIAVI
MGHTIGIYKGSYRLPDDIYQTAKISKLLLLMEQGGAAQFKGKSLNDIDLDLEENLLNTDDNMPITEATDLIPEVNICENKASGINSSVALSGASNSSKEQNKKEKRSLVPWKEAQQTVVVIKYFSDHIKNKKPPKKVNVKF